MMHKFFLSTATAIMLMALSVVAHADTVTLTSIGGTGVDATVSNYSLVGNRFTFTITNTATETGARGTITNIGFDLAGNRGSFALASSSNTNYRVMLDVNPSSGAQNFARQLRLRAAERQQRHFWRRQSF